MPNNRVNETRLRKLRKLPPQDNQERNKPDPDNEHDKTHPRNPVTFKQPRENVKRKSHSLSLLHINSIKKRFDSIVQSYFLTRIQLKLCSIT
jgi:hypothetical protein